MSDTLWPGEEPSPEELDAKIDEAFRRGAEMHRIAVQNLIEMLIEKGALTRLEAADYYEKTAAAIRAIGLEEGPAN